MTIKLERHHGLTVYAVYYRTTRLTVYLSEQQARLYVQRLKNTLNGVING